MPNANKIASLMIGAAALGACQSEPSEQNIIVGNNVMANADIEAVPADESSMTPTEELENGALGNSETNADSNSL